MDKVQVPFPRLPSFNISAVLLSYAAHEDEVHTWLHMLCRNTRLYSKSHGQLLRSFLRVNFVKLCSDCKKLTEKFDMLIEVTGMYTLTGHVIDGFYEAIREKFDSTSKQLMSS